MSELYVVGSCVIKNSNCGVVGWHDTRIKNNSYTTLTSSGVFFVLDIRHVESVELSKGCFHADYFMYIYIPTYVPLVYVINYKVLHMKAT